MSKVSDKEKIAHMASPYKNYAIYLLVVCLLVCFVAGVLYYLYIVYVDCIFSIPAFPNHLWPSIKRHDIFIIQNI